MSRLRPAPEWDIDVWLNTKAPLSLDQCRGRVVVALAFQMLCPGCVQTALPQMQRTRAAFSAEQVEVIGLHTVFEHHEVMTPSALEAFAHQYRLTCPSGVDRASGDGGSPATMRRYEMQGTPTLILIDREGRLRLQTFGHIGDLQLGAAIQSLLGPDTSDLG